MRQDLEPGNAFPDFELPDDEGRPFRLSTYMNGWPTAVVFVRGHYCPKDARQLANYLEHLQPELQLGYTKLVTVSTADVHHTHELKTGLGAVWPFVSDAERNLIRELDIVDVTDKRFAPIAIPYTYVLDADRTIYKVYFGWWFVGRPTSEELRADFRALLSRRADWHFSGGTAPVTNGMKA